MKSSTKQNEVLCFSRNSTQCTLQVSGNTLQQVEKFKYLRVFCTRDIRDVDTRIGKPNTVLRELYRSVATER